MTRERQLIDAVHRLLPITLHRQSMTFGSLSQNGTPDYYYDTDCDTSPRLLIQAYGDRELAYLKKKRPDLWVEYKQLRAMPRSGLVGGVDAKKKGCYSPLQFKWMERRYNNCLPHLSNVIGIVGLPNRTAVIQLTPTAWCKGSPVSEARPLKEIALWICAWCGG